jgi:mRNA export factor
MKYWDMRQPTAVATIQCQDKVYAMDVKDRLLVVATADSIISEVDLDQPDKFRKSISSPLKHQIRAISIFKDANGYTVGGIEGRCAFQYSYTKDTP